MENVKAFLKKKNVEISVKRYLVDALGAMAQGLFASLLIGTIVSTLGKQLGIEYLTELGGYASAVADRHGSQHRLGTAVSATGAL